MALTLVVNTLQFGALHHRGSSGKMHAHGDRGRDEGHVGLLDDHVAFLLQGELIALAVSLAPPEPEAPPVSMHDIYSSRSRY